MAGAKKLFQKNTQGTKVITNEDLRKNGIKDNQKVTVASGFGNQSGPAKNTKNVTLS